MAINKNESQKKAKNKIPQFKITRLYPMQMTREVVVSIDDSKIKQDKLWDGLKGYITNTHLTNKEVIENYNHLWRIEKAFRVSKTDIKIRPVYHQLQRRIEAHICLSFVAYKVYKELERQLKE